MKRTSRKWLLQFDRALSSSLLKQILILFLLMVAAFLLSYLMLTFSNVEWVKFCEENGMAKWTLPLYLMLDGNVLNNLYINSTGADIKGWLLFASSITYILGVILFSGMIISVLTNAISNRVEDHRKGRLFYLKSDHYIIMGYDDMVPAIISDIFTREPDAYVLLLTAIDAEKIREWLSKSVAFRQMERIIVNYGHRTMQECYSKIHIETAKEIFIVGRREIPTHDAMNVENVDSICSYLKQLKETKGDGMTMPKRITCVFEDLDTYTAFKTTEIFEDVKNLGIEFVPYNFYSGWAKQVFVGRCYKGKKEPDKNIPYPLMLREADGEERYAHLVFVGTTNCAVAMAIEAAHILHFPLKKDGSQRKTLITFIDRNANDEMDQFTTRYHHLCKEALIQYEDLTREPKEIDFKRVENSFLDIEFHFIKGDIFSEKVQERLCQYATDPKQSLSIFLAMRNPKDNFQIGMNMPDIIYYSDTPIFIRQDRSDNFVTNLRQQDEKFSSAYNTVVDGKLVEDNRHGRYANIYPFGMTDTGFSSDKMSLKRAKLVNYLYYVDMKEESLLNALSDKIIWNDANVFWNDLSVANKWSNLYNAYSIRIKLETLRKTRGLKLDDTSRDKESLNPDEAKILAVMEHNRWNVEKLLMGFSKPEPKEDKYEYPEFADKLKKNKKVFIHHDIRPFDKLDGVKKYDILISEHIPWILKMTERSE